MDHVKIEEGFRVTVPAKLRKGLRIGDQMIVTADRVGRIVLLSEKHIRAVLQRTAGLWDSHSDDPKDGVTYVNRLRRGKRLSRLGITRRETD